MNWKRGFRRLGWVATALATPIVALLTYDASDHRVGYRPRLLASGFPSPGDTQKRVVRVDDLGLFYFPSYLSESGAEEQMRSAYAKAGALQLANSSGRKSIRDFAALIPPSQIRTAANDEVSLPTQPWHPDRPATSRAPEPEEFDCSRGLR